MKITFKPNCNEAAKNGDIEYLKFCRKYDYV